MADNELIERLLKERSHYMRALQAELEWWAKIDAHAKTQVEEVETAADWDETLAEHRAIMQDRRVMAFEAGTRLRGVLANSEVING